MLGLAYKDECSAVWRQVEPLADQEGAEFAVSWLAIANASPRAEYKALLTVRDARGRLVEACPGFQNPTSTPGLIGPEQNPTDIGGLFVQVLSTDVAAASVIPFSKDPIMPKTTKPVAAGGATPKHVEPPPEVFIAPLQPKHVEPPPGAFIAPLQPTHVEPPPESFVAPLHPQHVVPPPEAFVATSPTSASVSISRTPPTTRVIIDRIPVPDDRTWVNLEPGAHTLRVGIAGAPGDHGGASLRRGATKIASAAVEIPDGKTEAYSAEVVFNV
jgi:hypothetical protein